MAGISLIAPTTRSTGPLVHAFLPLCRSFGCQARVWQDIKRLCDAIRYRPATGLRLAVPANLSPHIDAAGSPHI